jgi:hypothetical protein
LLLRLEQSAPNFVRALSIADQRLLDVLGDPAQPDSLVARLSVARRRFASPLALICQDIRGQLSVDGPPRFMAASAFL